MEKLLLVIIIIIVIITLLGYIIYRKYEFRNNSNIILEKFALSPYYQDDTINTKKIKNFNNTIGWDGIWVNNDNNIYSQFIQNNDLLIINLINPSKNNILDQTFNGIKNNYKLLNVPQENDVFSINIKYISPNSFMIIIQRIDDKESWTDNIKIQIFGIDNIYSETYDIGSSSTISKEVIITTTKKITILPEELCFPNSFLGIGKLNIKKNYFILSKIICNNYNNDNMNLKINKFSGYLQSDNSKITLYSDEISNPIILTLKTSLISKPDLTNFIDNVSKLPIIPQDNFEKKNGDIYNYMNFMPTNALINNGESSYICNYSQYFLKFNAYIIVYVNNLGNVRTLNNQFFNINDNNLVVNYDIMNTYFNDPYKKLNLLNKYRSIINTGTDSDGISNAISLTNCLENNSFNDSSNITSPSQLFSTCLTNIKNSISKFEQINNDKYMPFVWNINTSKNCNITINTFKKGYSTPIKYIEYDEKNLYLSLYNEGLNKQLSLDNSNLLKYDNNILLITANIKTLNNNYLVPNDVQGLLKDSSVINLSPTLDANGKWLILGFSLDNLNNLTSVLDNLSI